MTLPNQAIKDFWNSQATAFGQDLRASTRDVLLKQLEMHTLLRYVSDGASLLDVGCGNGATAVYLAQHRRVEILGIDYADAMVNQAMEVFNQARDLCVGTATFRAGDVLNLPAVLDSAKFQIALTERCVINLTSAELQIKAIEKVHAALDQGGIYLMLECTKQGLDRINLCRAQLGLPAIPMPWHNLYLDEDVILPAIAPGFELREVNHFASTYYLISRTITAKVTPPGEEPNYLSPINQYAAQLPSLGDYAPHRLFVLSKR
ncbi:MAG: class I SAM-dependent methyltransferase [Acidobacteria bacterium]|nr:class I SAM-dependent methyltransferase [Acidobacteriota bacterium]